MFPDDATCGRARFNNNANVQHIERCGDGRYVVRTGDTLCVWDVAQRTVLARIAGSGAFYTCQKDVVADVIAWVKSRGGGRMPGEAGPRPSPLAPWQA